MPLHAYQLEIKVQDRRQRALTLKAPLPEEFLLTGKLLGFDDLEDRYK